MCWGLSSPLLFSEWDEPYYFSFARRGGVQLIPSLFSGNFLDLSKAASSITAGIPHFFAGALLQIPAVLFEIPATTYGLFGDLVFSFLSFYLAVLLFEALTAQCAAALAASIAFLALPPFAGYVPHLELPLQDLGITTLAYSGYPCVSVLRGPFTQLSYPFFIFSLLALIKGIKTDSYRAFFLSGIAASLGIYTYFFSWITLLILVPIFVVLALDNRSVKRK